MIKIKLIILGVLLNIAIAYSIPIGIPPTITSINNVTSTSFIVNWSSGIVTGLSTGSSYHLNYIITVSGPGGYSRSTIGRSVAFSGLQPSTEYSIRLETFGTIIGETGSVFFSPTAASVTTPEAPIAEINTVSKDFTQQLPQTVIIKAKTKIILANGFHYKATDGFSLKTQLLPNTKSSDYNEEYTIYPDYYQEDADNQNVRSKDNILEISKYEILQSRQGCLTIICKEFKYSTNNKSEYYEVIDMKTGKTNKKGILSDYETQIDVSDLDTGFYVVKVTTDGRLAYTKKIIVKN